ncbi:glycosyltransferase family 2 protein [archaeon]|nr:glycosyltransferase family 2 protein [archaeon]
MIPISVIAIWFVYFILLYLVIFWLLVFFSKGVKDDNLKIKKYPLVSIVIPAYNEEKNIAQTIKSTLKLDYPKNKMEILIVNDGSKDKTSEVVKRVIKENKDFNIKLIEQENAGKGAAMNNALKKTKGEFFIPFDADSLIRSDALKKMIPVFETDKEIAAVLPLMKVYKPKTWIQKVQWTEYMVNLFYKKLMSELDCVSVAPGPFSIYRKKVMEEVNGFDENNLTEDLEITLRVQKKHYKVVQVFNTEVYTKTPKNFKQFYKQRNRWYKGTLLNAIKHRKMVFNKKYGDFGLIQMPRLLLESIFVLIIIFIVGYTNLIKPVSTKIYSMAAINFNFPVILAQRISNFSLLDIDFMTLFYTIIFMLLACVLIYYAHQKTGEPIKKHNIITVVLYILLYGILASVVIFGVFFDLATGKKQKW